MKLSPLPVWMMTGLVLASFHVFTYSNPRANDVTVLTSGETHAMLYPCDCPHDPGGGFAKRVSVVKNAGGRDSVLLVDAGGFAGGGIYDPYTEGRVGDSLRTLMTLSAMGAMGYDAVAVGDDDLQYGVRWLKEIASREKVPLISANCKLTDGSYPVDRYLLVKKNGVTFGITAVTTTERLFPIDNSVVIESPVPALKRIWKELTEKSDVQVVISHLGEENTRMLIDSFPGCALFVNGHRKTGDRALEMVGKTALMQFGFQGKNLSYADLHISGRNAEVAKSGWLTVGPDTPEDSTMAARLANPLKAEPNAVYDLYIMGQCPYGLEALKDFMPFVKTLPSASWDVWFIGDAIHDSIPQSLHGSGEVAEEKVWLAVKELQPGKWRDFLEARASETSLSDTMLKNLGIDLTAVGKWVMEKGDKALVENYLRAQRLGITASPTLLVNNLPFKDDITKGRLSKYQCANFRSQTPWCDSIPECYDDKDCKQKGKIGRCLSKDGAHGKCDFRDAAAFSFTALVADSTLQHPEESIIYTTEDLFPGANVNKVGINSKKGKELDKKYNPAGLPFYVFGPEVQQAYNFNTIENGLISRKEGLYFKEGITPLNYFHKRPKNAGKIELYIDPFFSGVAKILEIVSKDTTKLKKVTINPAFFTDPTAGNIGIEDRFRQEESLRWIVLSRDYPSKYGTYLTNFTAAAPSSNWFNAFASLGIPVDSFVNKVNASGDYLKRYRQKLDSLNIKEPVTLVYENREVIPVGNEREFELFLQQLNKR